MQSEHDLYTPERMEGVYACKVCGGFEGTLTTCCPRTRINSEQSAAIYAGTLNFRDGEWRKEPSMGVASHWDLPEARNAK